MYKKIISGAGLLLCSQALFALGLGDARVQSYLGQPLQVEINLISESIEELNTVTARMAAAADYEFVGMSQNISQPLRFSVIADIDHPRIVASSRLAVNEPVVQFVIEVSSAGGRQLKEYTLFLDPPTVAAQAPAPTVYRQSPSRPTPAPPPEQFPDPQTADMVETLPAEQQQASQRITQEVEPEPAQNETQAVVESVPVITQDNVAEPPEPVAQSQNRAQVPYDQPEPELPQSDAEESASVSEVAVAPLPDESSSTTELPSIPPDTGEQSSEDAIESEELLVAEAAELTSETTNEVVPIDEGQPPIEEANAEIEVAEQTSPESADDVQQTTEPVAIASENENQSESGSVAPQEATFDATSSEGEYSVQRGDTMWNIASAQTRGSDFSINQAMLAIQRLNPDAFGGNNINSLKAGVILRLPSQAEMGRLSQRQAMVEAMRQEEAHRANRAGLPFDDSPPAFADLAPAEPIDEVTDEPAVESATSIAQSDSDVAESRLELVPPSAGQGSGATGDVQEDAVGAVSSEELQETLSRTEEDLVNAQQENEYLNQRIAELEAQLHERAVSVDSNDLAEMESTLRADRLSDDSSEDLPTIPPQETAWYSDKLAWLIGLAVLIVGALVWWLRRMAGTSTGGDTPSGPTGTVVKIRSEAEEILETLEGEEDTVIVEAEKDVINIGDYSSADKVDDSEPENTQPTRRAKPEEETEVIELDTSDPETRLDLARAYLSMGDNDAAREMLDAVITEGNEDQIREAKAMMDEIPS